MCVGVRKKKRPIFVGRFLCLVAEFCCGVFVFEAGYFATGLTVIFRQRIVLRLIPFSSG